MLNLTLREVSEKLNKGETTSLALTEKCLSAIAELQEKLNCFIHVEAEHALKMADAADRELSNGQRRSLIHGIPLAYKDIFYRAGFLTTSGSRITKDFRPNFTGAIIKSLDDAGAVDLGGLHLSEFCIGPTGHNEYLGHCRNPWDDERISGGSSSGSAAAVAARLIYGSIGSDTGGSIRLPAGICGVTGLKTSFRRISSRGTVPRCKSLDCFGPIARTAEDVALLYQALRPLQVKNNISDKKKYSKTLYNDINHMRIGVMRNQSLDNIDVSLRNVHEEALQEFANLGADIVYIDISHLEDMNKLFSCINLSETAYVHRESIKTDGHLYNSTTLSRILGGNEISAIDYLHAIDKRKDMIEFFNNHVYRKVDVIYHPLISIEVPKIDDSKIYDPTDHNNVLLKLTEYTQWPSFLGLPVLALPCGFSNNKMPVAAQIIGPMNSEDTLLRLGHQYQCKTVWHENKPKICSKHL
jgi:aspartyl-tRNA(Asn)/glutamyl-tRNA(Gln) amidotransferase subunit A